MKNDGQKGEYLNPYHNASRGWVEHFNSYITFLLIEP